MRRALLLSTHFPQSLRRASFHWIADALIADGWHVDFATVGLSHLSRLRRDPRLAALPAPPRPGRHELSPGLTHLFAWNRLHPLATGSAIFDTILAQIARKPSRKWVPLLRASLRTAELVLIESGAPLLLVPLVRGLAPGTRIVYRVNDDLLCLGAPRWFQRLEADLAALCDRVSLASPHLARRFDHPCRTLDPMGVPRAALGNTVSATDPYPPRAMVEAVCAGTSHIDLARLCDWAQDHPHWRLHVVGRLRHRVDGPDNLLCHGEMPYARMLDFVAHADVGLAAYREVAGVEYQTAHSNRIQLYRHFGLPILGPDQLCHPSVPSLIGYGQPNAAFRCETWGRRPDTLPDWADLARALVQNPEIVPPFEIDSPPAIAR